MYPVVQNFLSFSQKIIPGWWEVIIARVFSYTSENIEELNSDWLERIIINEIKTKRFRDFPNSEMLAKRK